MLSRPFAAWLPGIVVVGLAAAGFAQDAGVSPTAEAGAVERHYALLIGCTVYPNLPPESQLEGPANDVALTASMLKEKFKYTDDEIVALVHDAPEDRRPTAANIEREFAALAERAAAGDIVFILIAGHGSQLDQDNPDDPHDPERDGKDEVFLPEDTLKWSLSTPAVGAIRDDQLGAWLDAIRAKGAFVFFVADTCHSGSMSRGGPDPDSPARQRWVDPQLLNPPKPAGGTPADAGSGPEEARDPIGVADTAEAAAAQLGPLIALYAVTDRATETEEPLPPYESTDNKKYGRLAFTLVDVLSQANEHLTYRELAQQIGWRYEGWNWLPDVGYLTGSGDHYDDEVLGKGRWSHRSAVTLKYDDETGAHSLDVGYLHGATVGSIYAVYRPAGAEDSHQAIGHVVVTELTPTTARVEPCAFGTMPETPYDELPNPGRCELAFQAASSLKLTVKVLPAPFDPPADEREVARRAAAIRALAETAGSLLAIAGDRDAPDAYVLVGSRGLYLRRATDATIAASEVATVDDRTYPPGVYGPFVDNAAPGGKLDKALAAMAKAYNIRRLAESGKTMIIGDPAFPEVTLEVRIERQDPATGAWSAVDDMHPIDAYVGDLVHVVITNTSESDVDVTVLYIDSEFEIKSFFPSMKQVLTGTDDNRLAPGQSHAVPFKITARTLGLEDVVIIATLTTPAAPRRNFLFLQQGGIERGGDANSAWNTPLGQLLSSAAFGTGERGGNAAPDLARYALRRLSWTVREQPSPEP
jgi:hypothetical protein